MATYQITKEQYLGYYKREFGTKRIRLFLFWVILIFLIILGFYIGQYLFSSFLIILIIIFSYLLRFKFTEELRYYNNPLLSSKLIVELQEDFYEILADNNQLKLSVRKISKVLKLKDFYRIDHSCGISLIIPKNILSDEDLKIVQIYHKRFSKRSKLWHLQIY